MTNEVFLDKELGDFIVYEYEGGEIVFVDLKAITSFHPKYVRQNCYRVHVTFDSKEACLSQHDSLAQAKAWCVEQIKKKNLIGS